MYPDAQFPGSLMEGRDGGTRIDRPVVGSAPEPRNPINVLVAGPGDYGHALMINIDQAEMFVVCTTRIADDLLSDVNRFQPDLVLISPELRGYSPRLVSQLAQFKKFPVAVVGLVPASGGEGSEMKAHGALGFFTLPLSPALAQQIMREAPDLVRRAREQWSAAARPMEQGPRHDVVRHATAAYRTGVIGCWSSKGGDGKSTVAVNLAWLLASTGQRVLLVDGDMDGGQMLFLLRLEAKENTLVHLATRFAQNKNRLTLEMLAGQVIQVDPAFREEARSIESNFHALLGLTDVAQAKTPEMVGSQGAEFMKALLTLAKQHYDWVVVDLGSRTVDAPHFAALETADVILVVTSSIMPSVVNNKVNVEKLTKQAQLRNDKFKVVLNRFDPADGLSEKEVVAWLGCEVYATIPALSNRGFEKAVNDGRPFLATRLNGRLPAEEEGVVKAYLKLGAALFPQIDDLRAKKKKGLFGFGKKEK